MTSRAKLSRSSRSSGKQKQRAGLPSAGRPLRRAALAEVKDDLSRFLRLAESEEILITRHGKPAGVLIGFAASACLLHSTHASMSQGEPVGAVIPRHAGDVQAVLGVANRSGTPVLPRGGGTSLTGQTVNRAIVVDFSPHMNRLLELNAEE